MLFSAPLANNGQHDSPHLHTLASWSSFSLSFSIKLVEPAPQPLRQILLLAWCHLIPRLSVGERVVPSAGKDPTSLMLQCKRLHGEEQVVSCPISALQGLYTAVLFKTWRLGIACDERSFAVEPSNRLVKYQTMICLVQTLLKMDGVLFRMWLDEPESNDLTCFVVFNMTYWA